MPVRTERSYIYGQETKQASSRENTQSITPSEKLSQKTQKKIHNKLIILCFYITLACLPQPEKHPTQIPDKKNKSFWAPPFSKKAAFPKAFPKTLPRTAFITDRKFHNQTFEAVSNRPNQKAPSLRHPRTKPENLLSATRIPGQLSEQKPRPTRDFA